MNPSFIYIKIILSYSVSSPPCESTSPAGSASTLSLVTIVMVFIGAGVLCYVYRGGILDFGRRVTSRLASAIPEVLLDNVHET